MQFIAMLASARIVGMSGVAPGEVSEDTQGHQAFWIGVLLGVPLLACLWLWWHWQCEEPGSMADITFSPIDLTPVTPRTTAQSSSESDDLRRIEGIGPKISELLQDVGIHTYAQLARSDSQYLARVLGEAGLRFIDPETWPEQAALAAQDNWDALAILQGELKGGRRV